MPKISTFVAVIGAGPAGLAASHALARRNIAHVVLEKGEAVGLPGKFVVRLRGDIGVGDLREKGCQITSNGHDTFFFPTLPDPSSLSHALGEGEHHFGGGEIHPLIVPT